MGADGSERVAWILAALPFWLGAAGVLGLDGAVGMQFLIYGEREVKVVVVEEGRDGSRKRSWRRVSGWMRGWVPSFKESKKMPEGEALLAGREDGYGTNETS